MPAAAVPHGVVTFVGSFIFGLCPIPTLFSSLMFPSRTQELEILGSYLSGNVLASIVFGVISVQIVYYFHHFPHDHRGTKILVSVLWLIQAIQVCCVTVALYWYLVAEFGDTENLYNDDWERSLGQLFTTAVPAAVQTFFVRRIYHLSNSIKLAVFVEALVVLQCGLGFALSFIWNRYHNLRTIDAKYAWLVMAWFVVIVTADIVIAICMCILLRRKRTGFKSTDSIIARMVIYTVNTSAITSVTSIIILVVFTTRGWRFPILLLGVPYGGLYTLAMLSNLLARSDLSKYIPESETIRIPISVTGNEAKGAETNVVTNFFHISMRGGSFEV